MSIRHRMHAWRDLIQRYRSIWLFYWHQRHELRLPTLKAHEAEFHPSALSIQSQPVSPTGRWVAGVLIALVLALFVWSLLGEIDIIVNAQGKIIPSERTKTITSVEVGSVRTLFVKEGQAVKAGDPLIELDSRGSDAEGDKAEGEWQSAFLQASRSRALLDALATDRTPHLSQTTEVPRTRWQEAERHVLDQWRDFVAKRDRLNGEIHRYEQALPLATQRAKDYADLARTHDVAEHAWLEKEQQRIDLEGQLNEAKNQKISLLAENRKMAQDTLNESLRVMAASRQDSRRASVHGELLKLVSPVDGTVQQLTAHTVGAAVPVAQSLMQIVPTQGVVEIEAFIENKDVGFVQEGQLAEVKIDAFEYTKYGTISSKVTHVSRDAIQDEKRGLIYAVKVELTRSSIFVDGKAVALSPGMSGSVEIKTGTRRIIEYVLSPLIQHSRESLRER